MKSTEKWNGTVGSGISKVLVCGECVTIVFGEAGKTLNQFEWPDLFLMTYGDPVNFFFK